MMNQEERKENHLATTSKPDTSGGHQQIKRIYEFLREISSKNIFVFLFCGLMGAITFITIYGTAVLDFTYTDWLMREGHDLTQHYLGWRFFRDSAWHFPIGFMDNIIHPFKTSVIYTDSIPLFAVIFKLMSPIFPTTFQYFGLFGLICYFMQGAVSGIVIKRLCNNTLFAIVGSMFFILSTTMAHRMFGHTALSAHFIILLCIYACITKADKQRSAYRNIAIWGGLLCLAVVTHMYFVPMVLIFMFFYLLDDCLEHKKILGPIIEAASSVALLLISMALMGAFSSGDGSSSAGGLGYYSANLLSFFNPMGTSTFLRDMPVATDGQYEGFGYMGLGIIMGGFLFVVYFLKNIELVKESLRNRALLRRLILTVALFAAFFIFALSPLVTFRDGALFNYPIPSIVRNVWEIFRSTGRFIWVPAYIIALVVIWAVGKEQKVKLSIVVLAMLLSIQVLDLKGFFASRGGAFSGRIEYDSPLPSSAWDEIAEGYQHLVHFPDVNAKRRRAYEVANIAVRNKMTMSDFNIARRDSKAINDRKEFERQCIRSGNASEDTIYFFGEATTSDVIASLFSYSRLHLLHIYEIDSVFIGVKEPITFVEEKFFEDVLAIYEMQELVELKEIRTPYQIGGWARPEEWGTWTDEEETVIALRLASDSDLLFHLNIADVSTSQPVDIYVNDLTLGSFEMEIGENIIEIPKSYMQNNALVITFSFQDLDIEDNKRLGIGVVSFSIEEKNG